MSNEQTSAHTAEQDQLEMARLEAALLHHVMLWYRTENGWTANARGVQIRLNDLRDKAKALHRHQMQVAHCRSYNNKIKPAEASD